MNTSDLPAPQMPPPPSSRLQALQKIWRPLVPMVIGLLVPWLIPGYFAAPVVFERCTVAKPLVVRAGEHFSVERFAGTAPTTVVPGDKLCDHNLALNGTATPPPDGTRLRLFNVAGGGGLFLHEPPLEVVNGQWHTDNVRPGSNIREIRFMRVSEATSRTFSEAASRNMWGPYPPPADAETVAAIRLEPVPVCAHLDARKCQKGE